ncbi:hypothetical protein [Sphaerospermopsis torques-reginae]|uniref:Uncharacterized protein n=1 Tax=Sphaerospermopsis torques-reginae ITEP-024 TaxID=984208 RepID=A0ABX8WW83_9CYAN|nr:hypothetical protein [Sphaerospermopsis torques-reginae]QYX30669.1 hypothetical protein K2F26_17535 [Sphaerospermopsis torques-reginae ITEP-024]
MLLYHGTSFENIERIRSQGVLPPRETKKSNCSVSELNDYESRNDAVYLSDAYAPYYAFYQYYDPLMKQLCSQLTKPSIELTTVSSKGALIEIDIDSLEQYKFYPDEDFLAHSSNLLYQIGETVKERTNYFKENLESYQDYLKDSLQEMGNCCYIGVIPPTAISRITTWCCKEVKILKALSYDYVYDKGGVTIFHDQEDSQILRLLTKCFAKREFQIDELLFLCKTKFQLDDNFDYDKTKDILIQEIERIEIVCDKDCDTI